MSEVKITGAEDAIKHRQKLFLASCIALIATAMTFAVRGDTIGALETAFGLTNQQVGWIMSGAFWGFTISIFIGGQLCDIFGMGRIMAAAFIAHVVGSILIIFANGFTMLVIGTLAIGLANGFVEAAINPLVATVYSDAKTQKLNALHAWFPGGIVIGGLVCFFITQQNIGELIPSFAGWQIKFASVLIPTIIYGILFLGVKMPQTERVQSGVSTKAMYKEAFRPLFLVWLFCMLLTAATELGTNQWISNIMAATAFKEYAFASILVLVWINLIMSVGRLFAGPVIHKLSPVKMLIVSAVLSAIGIFWMARVSQPAEAFVASFVFALGICYFWPTMLGVTSERFPKGGALLLGLMGAAGMASAGAAQPVLGGLKDQMGAENVLQYMVILPLILIVIFSVVYFRDKARGGYKIETLREADADENEKIEV